MSSDPSETPLTKEPASPRRRVTIADVARDAGVSISTASVVFSGKAPVAPATRDRVLASAEHLGYAGPDPRAASLRRGRSGIVAVVIEGPLRTAFLDRVNTAMMDGLTEGLARVGAGVLLLRDEPQHPDAPTLDTAPIDAVVLMGCSGRMRRSLESVRARQLPIVVIEGDAGEGVPRIELDNREAARNIAQHIADLGHERVAVVTLPFDAQRRRGNATPEQQHAIDVDVTRDRLDGVRDVFPDALVHSTAGSSIDEGLLAGRALLADPARRPTAILAQSDLLAAGVIRAADELGVHVPGDLSVTGFDGVVVDGLEGRVLTTAVQPAAEKGRAAGEAVARMLEGEPAESIRFTSVFRRGSTSGPPATS